MKRPVLVSGGCTGELVKIERYFDVNAKTVEDE